MLRQLNLAIDARPDASLADFTGPGWMPVIDAVRQLHVGLLPRFYVHGPTGSGKSHFLSAVCQSFEDLGRSAIQVSLRELIEAPTEALTSLETFELVALDDLEAIEGVQRWQEAVFHLINRSAMGEGELIFASRLPPKDLRLELPDLMSRIRNAVSFRLPNGDVLEDRIYFLEQLLEQRGWSFDQQVLHYLLEYGPHRPGKIIETLTLIEKAYHEHRRKPNAAFLRYVQALIDANAINQD